MRTQLRSRLRKWWRLAGAEACFEPSFRKAQKAVEENSKNGDDAGYQKVSVEK
jgi:hypothetical protein